MKDSKTKFKHNKTNASGFENEAAVFDNQETENTASNGSKFKRKRKAPPPPVVHIDNRSFLALLIRSFVSFMLITMVSMALVFLLAYWANNQDTLIISKRTIADYDDSLSKSDFSDIPVSKLCGKNGWLCVVDKQGRNVYTSDGEERSYTLSELECIQDYGSNERILVQSFKMPSGDYNHAIFRIGEDGSQQYLLLDADLRILSGSITTTKTQFTEKELELYTYNSRGDGVVMEKYHFTHNDDDYYAIYLDENNESGVTPYLFLIIIAVGSIALLIASLALYIKYINKHVQKPLKALSNAMSDFAQNGYREKLTYQGSKEFEQLVDSFNEMVSLLNASETQRSLLEQDRQRMLAGLSHDLKTPITVIQGFSKAMRDGLVSDDERQKYLNLILTKSESMGVLINGFYEYSKLDHPDFKLSVVDADVAEFARTYIANIYDEFELKGFNVDVDITEEKLICEIDKQQLSRVFENLTGNFFKYTPTNSTLYLRITKEGSNALIIFADNGAGMPKDMNDDIFAPFVVGEQSRSRQGSGLGLAVCKKIINAHGGEISLSETPIKGYTTQFEITLPLKEASKQIYDF
ncbi:MAG: HAMP domain-containing histidine kinase [Clostridia bacterium]|nr:HAMP domain-containing histidine kinase [Clostridia bacterium]